MRAGAARLQPADQSATLRSGGRSAAKSAYVDWETRRGDPPLGHICAIR
jgi:hypothetical protein